MADKQEADVSGNLAKTKNIRSLGDMQKLIEKAQETKKNAQQQSVEEEKLRQMRDARKTEMTKEERKAYRQSKRMTVEMKQNESRVKVSCLSFYIHLGNLKYFCTVD